MEWNNLISVINEWKQKNLKLYLFNPECAPDILKELKILEAEIIKLNKRISAYSFNSLEEEIFVFKHIKPKFIKEYIYLSLLYNLYNKYHDLELYHYKTYKKEINQTFDIINTSRDFYQYYKRDHTHLDQVYFTKLEHSTTNGVIYGIIGDVHSTCSHGFLMAKLMAIEKYQTFCMGQIHSLKQTPMLSKTKSDVQWNAKKVDAIELIYALYFSGAIRTKKGTLQEVAEQFEQLFNVEISQQLYRDYIDIKRRKIEPARFLMKLVTHFKTKIEEDYD